LNGIYHTFDGIVLVPLFYFEHCLQLSVSKDKAFVLKIFQLFDTLYIQLTAFSAVYTEFFFNMHALWMKQGETSFVLRRWIQVEKTADDTFDLNPNWRRF